jgi:hypothetical protein
LTRNFRKLGSNFWRYRAAIALLAILGGFALMDRRMLNSAPLYGVRPADAQWVLSTGDFPTFWREWERGDVFARIEEDWPRPQEDLELSIRLATGIRPTPVRWRLWLGERFTAAHSPEGLGCSVYPGLLLRTASTVAYLLGRRPDAAGIAEKNGIYYTWRDGFLIFSKDRSYVVACIENGVTSPLRSGSDESLALHWTGAHEGYMRMLGGPGVPVEGRLKIALNDGSRPVSVTNAWPDAPVASVTARTAADLQTLGAAADDALSAFSPWETTKSVVREAIPLWGLQPLPEGWDEGIAQLGLALYGADTAGFVPIPDLSLVMREDAPVTGDHPFRALFEDQLAIDYEWQGEPGVYLPWLGETLSPCLGRFGHDYIATLNEPAMASLVGALRSGPSDPPDVDLTLRVSWKPASDLAKQAISTFATGGLIPRMSAEEAQREITPMFDAIGELGTLWIDGKALEDGWTEFNGYLFDSRPSHGN